MKINKKHVEDCLRRFNKFYEKEKLFFETNTNDRKGIHSASCSLLLPGIGIYTYLLYKNKKCFQESLKELGRIIFDLFERHGKGEPITRSYVSLEEHKGILNVLASGDITLATQFAQSIKDNRIDDKERLGPFAIELGLSVISIVLEDYETLEKYLPKLIKRLEKNEKSLIGFAKAIEGLWKKDEILFNESINVLLKAYPRLRNGRFKLTPLEYICIWGLGLCNLAIHRGMKVDINDSDYLPKDLLIKN